MTNLAQFLLVIVITTLTILISVVAVQVWQILAEVRQAMKRLNQILNNTQTISETTAKPIAAVNQFFSEVNQRVDWTEDEIIESTPDTPKRPFFPRSGLPLRAS